MQAASTTLNLNSLLHPNMFELLDEDDDDIHQPRLQILEEWNMTDQFEHLQRSMAEEEEEPMLAEEEGDNDDDNANEVRSRTDIRSTSRCFFIGRERSRSYHSGLVNCLLRVTTKEKHPAMGNDNDV